MQWLRAFLLFVLVLSFSTLACNLLQGEQPTAEPTQAPLATNTAPPDQVATDLPATATEEPTPAPSNTPEAAATQIATPTEEVPPTEGAPVSDVELASRPYVNGNGVFSLVPPAGWEVSDGDGFASFDAPDGSGFIYVQATNTGHELDGRAFTNFVENRDLNFFSGFDDYTELEKDVNTGAGDATVTKSLSFEEIPQSVVTIYKQHGSLIYSFDFWSADDHQDVYADLYSQIMETVQVNTKAASEQPIYNWIYTFTGPNNLFSIEVPTPWRYEQTDAEFTVVDTFYAPDDHAVIQNIAYDDGQEITRSQAGDFALELLRTYYATDIQILGDEVQADGSERLTWASPSGDYSGTSFFETRGTTFLLFTTMYDNPYEDTYLETLNYTISTYDIPES